MLRRTFLGTLPASLLARNANPKIVVRGGWQWENIGDIAHTPGLLTLIEKHIPGAHVTLASTGLGGGARELLLRRFPKLVLVESLEVSPGSPLEKVFDASDLLIHGSGSGFNPTHLDIWRSRSKKPFGLFGVTVSLTEEAAARKLTPAMIETLDAAAFLFTRETQSLANVRGAGVKTKIMDFGPDATFSMDLTDEPAAERYLAQTGLAGKRFIAVIPRLRYTPYYEFRKTNLPPQLEIDRRKSVNARYQEEDAAKLREVVIRWVRETGGHALLCAEMTYQLGMIHPLLYDPLPDDVKKNVVPRKEYWMPGEAASIYKRASGVVSCECHSPIMSIVHSTPAFYVRQPEDTIKGQMYADLGVGDWAPRIEETSASALADLVLTQLAAKDKARARAAAAAKKAQETQARAMAKVREIA